MQNTHRQAIRTFFPRGLELKLSNWTFEGSFHSCLTHIHKHICAHGARGGSSTAWKNFLRLVTTDKSANCVTSRFLSFIQSEHQFGSLPSCWSCSRNLPHPWRRICIKAVWYNWNFMWKARQKQQKDSVCLLRCVLRICSVWIQSIDP